MAVLADGGLHPSKELRASERCRGGRDERLGGGRRGLVDGRETAERGKARLVRLAVCSAVAAVLLALCAGPAGVDSDPRSYAPPGAGVGPLWIGEPMEMAAIELWRLAAFAHDDQGRPTVFVDSGGNPCVRNPGWCIAEDDTATKTPGLPGVCVDERPPGGPGRDRQPARAMRQQQGRLRP